MKRLLLLLLPAVLTAGQARYARLGEFEGQVEIQMRAGGPWTAAERNLPLVESAWLRTGPASRLEIEFDEGSAWRLGPDTQVEISDYTRLSTGQLFTVLSLDRGVAYFTGEPGARDTLTLAVPGAQITLSRGARVRLEADPAVSRISIVEGIVRLYCPAAELDIREGQSVRVEPANPARFTLDREVVAMDLDRWSEERDKALATSTSGAHVAQRFGVVDLDAAGEWVQTDFGAVWKPKVEEGWVPFQKGRWRWYDTLGYTWVSDDAWGWVPYHFGRWTRKDKLGWVWAPSTSPVFKPGDVYWLWNAKLAGWGPLAPGENWVISQAPEQFLNANTTYAKFQWDQYVIDPAGFQDRPKEPLGDAVFALALPSPPLPASRLEATRPELRVGATHRVMPVIPGTVFQETNEPSPTDPEPPPAVVTNPASDAPPDVQPGPPDQGPPGPPMQVIYPVPVYTGIVVLNPPEHPPYSRHDPNSHRKGNGNDDSGNQTTPPPPTTPTPPPAPVNPPRRTGSMTVSRPGPLIPPVAPGRPTALPRTTPAPVAEPTLPAATTPTPAASSAPPRLTLPRTRPGPAPSADRPNPAPLPAGRGLPRVSTPAPARPQVRPERGAPKPEAKPDTAEPKEAPQVKKQ